MLKSLFLILLVFGMAAEAAAQTHTVEVRSGDVYVDGELVQPASRSGLAGVDARVEIPAGAVFIFELDGRVVRVSGDGVLEVRPASTATATSIEVVPAEASFIAAQAEELRMRAREMERIGVQLQSARVPDHELFQMIEMLRHSAMEAERVAQALPHFRVQGYLSQVREQNEELYERLVREQRLEDESVVLSQQIRMLQGAEREARMSELRQRLDEIFQIKQDNRRREIEELEGRLTEMQKRLEKRERHRDYIIERRLQQLIGSEEGDDARNR